MEEPLRMGREPPLWRRVLAAPEGKILLAGGAVFLFYAAALGLVRVWRPALASR